MKKRMTKIAAMMAVAAMCTGMFAGPAMAATTYTPVAGTSCNFNKYLIMDAGDNVPNATFSFTIAPGSAISADTSSNDSMEVMAGVGTPTIADVTFSNSDTTATAAGSNIDVARTQEDRTGTAGTDTVQLDTANGEKYATKQATIDFSGVTFNEPGIYRYIVTETANTAHAAAGIIHDTDTDRVLDVYVTDDGNGSLVVSGYVMHTDVDNVAIGATMGSADVTNAGDALDDKTDGFTNEYVTKDLAFKKEVTGNQASRDKYFEYTVTATNVNDNDVFTVSLADDSNANTEVDGNADATSGAAKIGGTIAANAGKTNPTTVTGAQLKAGQKFYLQHGQSIVIRGLAQDAGYTVAENAEDYKSAASAVTGYTDAVSGTIGTIAGDNKTVKTSFKNTRDGVIPTGVIFAAVPGMIAAAGAGAGIGVMKRRRRDDEDCE